MEEKAKEIMERYANKKWDLIAALELVGLFVGILMMCE